MGKKRRGKTARNARKGISDLEPVDLVKAPHSFVINRGKLGKSVNELMLNFRKIMEPFTATQLKVQKQNVLKDFVHMAGPLNVSHLIIFTKSQKGIYLRLSKLPRGPTLTFEVKEYALAKDIISSQKKSVVYEKLFEHHPLLVLNNFSGEGMHFKLMATMFQNMFPSINVNKANLNSIRRCLLLNYNEDKSIDLRQYAIKVVPAGVSKGVKKLIQSKVPNLGQYQDVGEFLQKSGNLSESEVELDSAVNTVVLPQSISTRGNIASETSAIRLYELGPRLKLQLIKIEEGLMTGEVLFHEYVKKTPEEIKALKARIKAKRLLKEQRRSQQEKNVERKKKAEKNECDDDSEKEREEDMKWYREEVGEEPDDSVIPGIKKRKASFDKQKVKKPRVSEKRERKDVKPETKHSESGKTETIQEFLVRRKKRKAKLQKKKASKKQSSKILSMKTKHKESFKVKRKFCK